MRHTHAATRTIAASLVVGGLYSQAAAQSAPPAAPYLYLPDVVGAQVTLRWTRPPGVILGYRVEAGVAPDRMGDVTINLGVVERFEVTAPTGVYYVSIRALGLGGWSGPSNFVVAYVNVPWTPWPPTPTPCVPPATPGIDVMVAGRTLTVQWTIDWICTIDSLLLVAEVYPDGPVLGSVSVVLGDSLSFSVTFEEPVSFWLRVYAVRENVRSAPTAPILVVTR